MSASVVERDCVAERALWASVLELAIRDATCEKPRYAGGGANAVRNSALRWIKSESDSPASFRWVCGLFDLCPAVVRRRVLVEGGAARG